MTMPTLIQRVVTVALVALLLEMQLINAYRLSVGPFLTHRLFNHGGSGSSSSSLIANRHITVGSIELSMSSIESSTDSNSGNNRHFDYLVIGGGNLLNYTVYSYSFIVS